MWVAYMLSGVAVALAAVYLVHDLIGVVDRVLDARARKKEEA